MLFEIHMLKNYPATNLNRDDTGAPKTCTFGGVQRSRISSQCLKRSWRESPVLREEIDKNWLGIRTRKLPVLVCDKLKEEFASTFEEKKLEEYLKAVKLILAGIGKSTKEKAGDKDDDPTEKQNESGENETTKQNESGEINTTKQIVFYSQQDIDTVTNYFKDQIKDGKLFKDDKPTTLKAKELKEKANEIQKKLKSSAKNRPITVDIALFGRMVTSDAFADVDASMQVAHAFSTNKVIMETDFFTAMDDMIDGKEENGSAMMGDTDYNSACYYIYASIDVDKLKDNLKNAEDREKIVDVLIPALLKAMSWSNPGGKQNSFAGNVLPSAILIECKDYPVPVSYANAFVKPVQSTYDTDLVKASVQRLVEHVQKIDEEYNLPIEKRYWFCAGLDEKVPMADRKEKSVVENCQSFSEMLNNLRQFIAQKK
jgi:CRISPR system Cascade subunit CasC